MAFKRGRKKHVKRATANGALALKMVRQLKRTMAPEHKIHDVNFANTCTTTGNIVNLTRLIASGIDQQQRIGKVINMTSMAMRSFVTQNSSAEKTIVRIIIFRGKQENGIAYNVDDVLQTASTASNNCLAPVEWLNRTRYTILYDKTVHMSNNGDSQAFFKHRIAFKRGKVYWVAEDDNIENAGLYLLFISNEGTNLPTFNSFVRIQYTDC